MTTLLEKQEMTKVTKRLRGYVQQWFGAKDYGFIAMKGMKDERTGRPKQWHVHRNSVLAPGQLAVGVMVEFTHMDCPAEGKCDKAVNVEVVG